MGVEGERARDTFRSGTVKDEVQRGETGHAVTLGGLDDEGSKQAADALRGDLFDEAA